MDKNTFKLSRFAVLALVAVGLITWSSCGSETAVEETTDTVIEGAEDAAGDAASEAAEAIDEATGADASATEGANDLSFDEGSWGWNIYNYMETGNGSMTFNLDKIPLGDDDAEEASAEGKKQLDDLAAILNAYPDMRCEVQGHTKKAKNPIGAKAKQAWSGVKATWVKEKLKARGASGDQIDAKGYGDQMLLTDVAEDDDSQRRVVVVFNK